MNKACLLVAFLCSFQMLSAQNFDGGFTEHEGKMNAVDAIGFGIYDSPKRGEYGFTFVLFPDGKAHKCFDRKSSHSLARQWLEINASYRVDGEHFWFNDKYFKATEWRLFVSTDGYKINLKYSDANVEILHGPYDPLRATPTYIPPTPDLTIKIIDD